MEQKQFLTVMAVLDENTQKTMECLQKRILGLGTKGTQTMGIPFHITLGSFPIDKQTEVLRRMWETAEKSKGFSVKLRGINTFSDRVLFLQPEGNERLWALHQPFDCAYADGFPWTPHATLFCGETAEVQRALREISDTVFPLYAHITALELGCFFPARFISRIPLMPEAAEDKEAVEP